MALGLSTRARVAALGVMLLGVSADAARTHTHENADGSAVSWYPRECCHDGDCRPVSHIVRAPQGLWMTTVDNQTVLVGPSDRRLPSRDMRWHLCITYDVEAESNLVRCIFEPPDS
jgi:hypothetical protein